MINYIKKKLNEDSFVKIIFQFLFNIFFYGIILNIMFTTFLNFSFGFNSIISLGILYYFIKVELPPIITECFFKRG
jgi:uncharacterized membrane protein